MLLIGQNASVDIRVNPAQPNTIPEYRLLGPEHSKLYSYVCITVYYQKLAL